MHRAQAKNEIMRMQCSFQDVGLTWLALAAQTAWAAGNVSFSQPVETVEAHDFVEVIARVDKPDVRNRFLGATITGWFTKADGSDRKTVEGFCDSVDGSVFRIRFMPASPGDYTWSAREFQLERTARRQTE